MWCLSNNNFSPIQSNRKVLERLGASSSINTLNAFGLGWKLLRLRFVCLFVCFVFFFFFSRVFELFECCGYCLCTVQWTVIANFDFSKFFGPISAHCVLFMDLQISLFSNFFITNGSHGTIYTFKNYFATVFFSFQFQFSVFSCILTDPL